MQTLQNITAVTIKHTKLFVGNGQKCSTEERTIQRQKPQRLAKIRRQRGMENIENSAVVHDVGYAPGRNRGEENGRSRA
jgi:hypothetical protein